MTNRRDIFSQCLILFLGLSCAFGRGDLESSSSATEECMDTASWCAAISKYCHDPATVDIMKKDCAKTCDLCTKTNRTDCRSMACQHNCKSDGNGAPTCVCKIGYKIMKDGKSCQDIDECKQDNPCPSKNYDCVNTEGSFRCDVRCRTNEATYYGTNKCCLLPKGGSESCGINSENGGPKATGQQAIVTRWPWMAFISEKSPERYSECAGILLDKSWVLAAAHCFERVKTENIQLLFGIANGKSDPKMNKYSQRRTAESVVIHPGYQRPHNDIAMIKLNKPVEITNYVRPNCMPFGEQPLKSQKCWAVGYAMIPEGGRTLRWLQQEGVSVSDNKMCEGRVGNKLNKNLMCISHTGPINAHDCQGSTGGPLVCQRCSSCEWYVAGMATERISCSIDKNVSAFTNVPNMENWIRRTMGSAELRTISGPQCKPLRKLTAWSEWGSWGRCSSTCGNGTAVRHRVCEGQERDNSECPGESKQIRSCEMPSCTPGCSEWTNWSPCSVTCDFGSQQRTRECVKKSPETQEKFCRRPSCPPVWSEWSAWSECSTTCNGGIKSRRRQCVGNNPRNCRGADISRLSCNEQHCPAAWTEWSAWSACDTTCGDGMITRQRDCPQGNCNGPKTEGKLCHVNCPPAQNACDKYADVYPTQCKEIGCSTSISQIWRYCALTCCTAYRALAYSEWSMWTPCSKSCGGGLQRRRRNCMSPELCASFGENLDERKRCNVESCFARTSEVAACSASCGGGIRHRKCLDGECAEGQNVIIESCNTEPCPNILSDWSVWTQCSTSCGVGSRERSRNCTGGSCDTENLLQVEECNMGDCVTVNGTWSEWGPWDSCSALCGLGTIKRRRTCSDGKCEGNSEQEEVCFTTDCNDYNEPSQCADDPNMQYLCSILRGNCRDAYMKQACRKTCGLC